MATLVIGGPAVRRMLGKYEGSALQNRLRRAVRAGAKPFQVALQSAAASDPTGNVPESFRKVRAAKVSTRGGFTGRDIVARVRPESPLFNIFEPGAQAHDIEGPMMAGPEGAGGWTSEGRKRPAPFGARGRVRHPGMAARPILPTAFGRGTAAAKMAVATALFAP